MDYEYAKVTDPREILNSAGYEDVPAVLLPYQQEWIADKSPLKVAENLDVSV